MPGRKQKTPAQKPREPRVKRVGSRNGLTVWLVDGSWVRKNIDEEFSNFGHHYTYDEIPKGELWLDDETDPDERKFYVGRTCGWSTGCASRAWRMRRRAIARTHTSANFDCRPAIYRKSKRANPSLSRKRSTPGSGKSWVTEWKCGSSTAVWSEAFMISSSPKGGMNTSTSSFPATRCGSITTSMRTSRALSFFTNCTN